jgi:hypothetical protein
MPDRPITPLEVNRQLGLLTGQLDSVVAQLVEAELVAARKRHRADDAESHAFINAEGAMDMRKHKARITVGAEREEALVSEAVVRGLKYKVKALEIRIDVGRTFGATVRAELKTLGWQEG